jgi:phosphotransferase system enzyme I (PtsP)
VSESAPLPATIHGRGPQRLDAVCDLVMALATPRPLSAALDDIPARVAAVFESVVCSVYLREGNDLVMRGNVGFGHEALGEVRLAVGEGLVGTAVELMRPVSTDAAASHARARVFPGLGEERYPALLAVPVPGPSGPAGALVVQRQAPGYTQSEVELLVALAGAVAPVVGKARIVDAPAPKAPGARHGAPGDAHRAYARAGTGPRGGHGPATSGRAHRPGRGAQPPLSWRGCFDRAVMECDTTLEVALRSARRRGHDTAALELARMILADGRLRERTLELAASRGLVPALAQVAREATRSARLTDVPIVAERAHELSELCDALRVLVSPTALEALPQGAVWLGETLTVFDLVMAARRKPSAVVLSGRAPAGARLRALVELLDVPAVSEVAGLFAWVSDGDVVLVDGGHGLVRVNPTRRERDEARVARG